MSRPTAINASVGSEYTALRDGTHKYIIFNLSEDLKEIVVEKCGESKEYDDFLEDLPEAECRWAVYDLEYDTPEGKKNKPVFISWSPEDAKIKHKMAFAASKDSLRRSLVGIGAELRATQYDEVAFDNVEEAVLKKLSKGR